MIRLQLSLNKGKRFRTLIDVNKAISMGRRNTTFIDFLILCILSLIWLVWFRMSLNIREKISSINVNKEVWYLLIWDTSSLHSSNFLIFYFFLLFNWYCSLYIHFLFVSHTIHVHSWTNCCLPSTTEIHCRMPISTVCSYC